MSLQLSLEECRNQFEQSLLAGYVFHERFASNSVEDNCKNRMKIISGISPEETDSFFQSDSPEMDCIDSFLKYFLYEWVSVIDREVQRVVDVQGTNTVVEESASQVGDQVGSGGCSIVRFIDLCKPKNVDLKRAASKPPAIFFGRQIRVDKGVFAITNAVLFAATAYGALTGLANQLEIVSSAIAVSEAVWEFSKRGKLEGTELCLFVKCLYYVGDGLCFERDTVVDYWFSWPDQPCNLPVRKRAWWCWHCPEIIRGNCNFRQFPHRYEDKIAKDLASLIAKRYLVLVEQGYCVAQ